MNRRRTLLVDLGIALVAMIVLVIVSAGLAIVGLVALLLLAACGLTFVFQLWRDRRRARAGRGGPPGRRPPPARRPPPRRPAGRY